MTQTAFSLSGVSLARGERTILRTIDLSVPSGCFIGLLGSNGAGKTSLMRALLGLLPPQAGQILVFGEPPRRGNPLIGYMPQTRSTSSVRLSGRAAVAACLAGHRWGIPWSGAKARSEIDRVLDLVDATELGGHPLDELSGGERQRLLLAQALLGSPRLLLLDEPLISLDPSRADAVVQLVHRVQCELGITVLFSAHELNPLLSALDTVLYLGGGRARLGTIEEVVTGPALSELYGAPIEVTRAGGRIFVMLGRSDHVPTGVEAAGVG